MKPIEVYITSGLGALSILLVIALITLNQANQGINKGLQAQQEIINKGLMNQQVGQSVVRDMAEASLRNTKMRELLSRYGINVNVNK
ncbi:MAG: hypothetical protein ACFCUX_06625 [Candidatus Methylacidiphilales bacterium]